MSAENHPAYHEELEHLNYTLNYVEKSLETTTARHSRTTKDVHRLNRPSTDNSQDFIDLMVNSKILGGLTLKLRNLETARGKPYFARIDFHEKGKPAKEALYIGKICLTRDEDQRLIIVDWRAPIANMYYESRLGEASYHCPEGEITGNLSLKRQFSINDAKLDEIFDIDITTNDQFLQSYLGANADNRLKDIVSTIQAEQNRVIRAEMERPLIVQGVAGSGKTTIALHRIAFLIYNYDQSFVPENFMIIAPNRLFLNYISEVLPELGVERVKQSTFEDFATEVIAAKFKIKDPFEKLLQFVEAESGEAQARNEVLKQVSIFKSGLGFKAVLDEFLKDVEARLIPKTDFGFENRIFYHRTEIEKLFTDDYRDWPVYRRIDQLKKHFQKRVKEWKDGAILKLNQESRLRIDQIKMTEGDTPERQQQIIAIIDGKNEMVEKVNDFAKNGIKEYLKQVPVRTALEYYREFFEQYFISLAHKVLTPEVIALMNEITLQNLKKGVLEIEDLAPVMYIKYFLYGLDEKIRVKHIVIDEAQDFSTFQVYTLRKMIENSSFTILGDLGQGIHSYRGIVHWEEIRQQVFEGQADFQILEQSYRTTVEIMEVGNQVLSHWPNPELVKAKPVIRHGEPVQIIQKPDLQETTKAIAEEIRKLKKAGFKSMAIIGKTLAECQELTKYLKESSLEPKLISGRESEYDSGLVVVPSYLAKGLEFDVVFLANANRQRYHQQNELDIKLLYVAVTRPLHRLIVYYTGELTELLAQVPVAYHQ